jgi:hypothetical protein
MQIPAHRRSGHRPAIHNRFEISICFWSVKRTSCRQVSMSAIGPKQTSLIALHMSAFGGSVGSRPAIVEVVAVSLCRCVAVAQWFL